MAERTKHFANLSLHDEVSKRPQVMQGVVRAVADMGSLDHPRAASTWLRTQDRPSGYGLDAGKRPAVSHANACALFNIHLCALDWYNGAGS
ncbi:MAG TPA: hypothetical protein VIX85_00680 [Acidimicrobiales bacterium]